MVDYWTGTLALYQHFPCGAYPVEALMSTTLLLEGLAVLAVIVVLINANWNRLTTDPEEDAV